MTSIPARVALSVARVGGALLCPPESSLEARRAADILGRPNPLHRSWMLRVKRNPRLAQYEPAPPDRVVCAGTVPSGAHEGWTWLPRYAPVHVRQVVDATVRPPAEFPGLRVELRPYQQTALRQWQEQGRGVVVAPCGGGKTTIGVGAIQASATPALVLVHTIDLAKQWRDRVSAQLGVDAGLIGDSKRTGEDRPVVVATIQTLARWTWAEREEWGARFGLVVLDEAHHCPAKSFTEVASSLPGRLRLALTATPVRQDGLIDFLWWSFGPAVSIIEQADLEAGGSTLRPTISWVRTGWEPEDGAATDAIERANQRAADEPRNALIVRLVLRAAAAGRRILVVTDRVEHCHALAALVEAGGVHARALVGHLSARVRTEVLDGLRSGSVPVVTATSVADEGLDVPELDTVFLVDDATAEAKVQQRVGRCCRPLATKRPPVVIDFIDGDDTGLRHAKARRRIYQRLGWAPPEIGGA